MREYSQEEINELIRCEKTIVNPPKKAMTLVNGHNQNGMDLISAEDKKSFHCFMRQNAQFPEDFSVGLIYMPEDGSGNLPLIRCNGPHGPFDSSWPEGNFHCEYHIHKAKPENIIAGLKPDKDGEITHEYATVHDAIAYLIEITNITGAEKYFSFLTRPTLFNMEG